MRFDLSQHIEGWHARALNYSLRTTHELCPSSRFEVLSSHITIHRLGSDAKLILSNVLCTLYTLYIIPCVVNHIAQLIYTTHTLK